MMGIMRYPEGHKEAVRKRIVAAAADSLRQRGLSGVSIPELMKAIGLTHGGFYAHFDSRDDLVAAAIEAAGAQTAERVFKEDVALADALRVYLSEDHVAHPEVGCVVAALGTDGARHAKPVRRAFANVTSGLLRLVDRKLHPASKGAREPSDEALRLTSTMVGAVVLARLTADPALAERLLGAARRSLRS
jgi:TetR/AcrR family transcriptional regulator, transcriptional repressor for nem operon